jgi:YHS domain-containing protein
MRRLALLLIAALMIVTVGIASAAREGASAHAALQGYCPVAYVAMSKAVKGDPKISSVVEGRRYLFTNADAKKMFDASPGKYQVAYEGWCATAMSMGKKIKSDPKLFSVLGGRTYLFSNAAAKKAFDGMPEGVIQKADAQWAAMTNK